MRTILVGHHSNDGVYSVHEDGNFTDAQTYWVGFEDRFAKGLRFEWLRAGEQPIWEE